MDKCAHGSLIKKKTMHIPNPNIWETRANFQFSTVNYKKKIVYYCEDIQTDWHAFISSTIHYLSFEFGKICCFSSPQREKTQKPLMSLCVCV